MFSSDFTPQMDGPTTTSVQCEYSGCDQEFSSAEALFQHQVDVGHLGITCHLCTREYSSIGKLKRHIETVHSDAKNYACMLCSSAFNRQDN